LDVLSPFKVANPNFILTGPDGGVINPETGIPASKRALNPSKVVMDFVVVVDLHTQLESILQLTCCTI
jgi:hypothetical protein